MSLIGTFMIAVLLIGLLLLLSKFVLKKNKKCGWNIKEKHGH